jgi:hypothetical protein
MNAGKAEPHRCCFLDKAVLYVFSYNVELSIDVECVGLVPGGARINVNCVPGESRVYHVLRERIGGKGQFPLITGTIIAGGDQALIREDDVAISSVRMIIKTDDGALIASTYRGISYLGMGGYREVVSGNRPGAVGTPIAKRIIITPQYETSSSKYKWLMDERCVGFGRLEVMDNILRRATYDIYAMM